MSVQNIERKIIGFVFAIVSIIVLFFMAVNIKNKSNQNIAEITDPEILRAISYGEITDADKKVDGCDYVEFSAFFTRDLNGDGYAEKVKGSCREISQTDTMYAELNVLTQGSLRDAKITVNGENFVWQTAIVEDQIVKGDYIGETSEITLQPILNPGSQKLLWGTIKSNVGDNVNNYTKINSVTLTGKYYDEDGNFVCDINQTRNVTVDWYGETKTEVNKYYYSIEGYKSYENQLFDIAGVVKDNSVDLTFRVATSETNQKLLLQGQIIEVTIPQLNGFDAIEVNVTENNVQSTYENGKLTITKTSELDDEGNVTKSIARSSLYTVTVKYPLEAYDQISADSIVISIPVKGTTKGYNNQNAEFDNPHVSTAEGIITATYSKPSGDIWNIYASVGRYEKVGSTSTYRYQVSKEVPTDIFNGNVYGDKTTIYPVKWEIVIGDYTSIDKIELKEGKKDSNQKADEFLDSRNKYTSMREYETTTGVYFTNARETLGNDGWIKLYNVENGEEEASLLETFTKDNWNSYTKENPYAVNTKSIKVETSKPVKNTTFSVYQIKEMDDEKIAEDFSEEEFERLSYVYTNLIGTIEAPEGITYNNEETTSSIYRNSYAYYDAPYSLAKIEANPNQINNQKTEDVEFKITTISEGSIEKKWINGAFIIALPNSIINASINSVQVSEDGVQIQSSDVYEENGRYFIKIYTKNEEEKTYTITVNTSIAGNPLNPTEVKDVKLYAFNEVCDNYYNETQDIYDLDADGNRNDNIGFNQTSMTLIAPSGLLTTEYVTDYDDENNVTIAPNIADIEKSDETRTANINVSITNGYSGTISDIVILGRIPFEGNKYVLNGGDLNSGFTANITGEINVPDKLQDYAKIYYSTKENANKDLADTENEWKTAEEVTDWSQVRSYLIDLQDYTLAKEEKEVFKYEVNVPAGLGYNSASFSDHAVYYNLDTENGKLAVQTEPNKVGIQVIGKYNLQLTKNKKAHDNIYVQGATYSVTTKDVDGNDITKSATTNDDGVLTLRGLYVGREYTLKEISAPSDYAVSTDEIVFEGAIGVNGNLGFNVKQGEFKDNNAIEITTDEKQNYLVKADIEDEAKYTLKINKTDEEGTPIKGVKFILKGREKAANVYKTDENGIVIISGLCPEAEYELQEIKADGYYTDTEPRKFKIIRNEDGILKVQTNDDKLVNEIKDENITELDTNVNAEVIANIVNEKIPTYNLQIIKTGENDSGDIVPLRDAVFKLVNEDTGEQREYTTDENGTIDVADLCAHVNGKYITGNYILQETKAPSEYANNAEKIKFNVTNNNGNLSYSIQDENNLVTLKQCQINENTLKLTIQDEPIFKLIKEDSETGERLKNAKFVIIELDDNYCEIDYAKDVNGYYVGQKNEKNEYIVTTDENGIINLPLKNGLYKIKEVGYPENYIEGDSYEIIRIGEKGDENDNNNDDAAIKINSIEQLLSFLNSSNDYSGKTVVLMRTLDFKDPNSYESGIIRTESITGRASKFCGTFDGQGYEIRNVNISYTALVSSTGLFHKTKNATIRNLGVRGSVYSSGATGHTGGLIGASSNNLTIDNCFFEGNIKSISTNSSVSLSSTSDDYVDLNSNHAVGGLVGIVGDSQTSEAQVNITNSHFEGKIEAKYSMSTYIGGIIGSQGYYKSDSTTTISNCFNRGDIDGTVNGGAGTSYTYVCAGGIIGLTNNATIRNTYNTGSIKAKTNAGGIAGSYGGNSSTSNALKIINSYNIGYVNGNTYSGGIIGVANQNKVSVENSYYLDNISQSTYGTRSTEATMISRDFYNDLNVDGVWSSKLNDYPILSNEMKAKVLFGTEVSIKNTIKKYNITTYRSGNGSISGASSSPYEIVRAGESNQKEIIAEPGTGNTISKITINGVEIEYKTNDDGTYIIPAGYFENIQEDIEIRVTFSPKNSMLTIDKEDRENGKKLEGATFKIEQIEDRPDVTNEVGNLTENGKAFYDLGEEIDIEEVVTPNSAEYSVPDEEIELGESINVSGYDEVGTPGALVDCPITFNRMNQYYFPEDGDIHKSDNKGIANSTANSMAVLNLTNLQGKYVVVVNASISSQKNYDWGFATLSKSSSTPQYDNHNGQFIYISGNISNTDYTSMVIDGGSNYFLHFGYRKDGSVNSYNDEFCINSIKVYKAEDVNRISFTKNQNEYIPNNTGLIFSTVKSRIPIDLTNEEGSYTLMISGQMTGDNGYLYATVRENESIPEYNESSGRIMYLFHTGTANDKSMVLNGGKKYYLYLCYENGSSNTNTAKISNLKLYKNANRGMFFKEYDGAYISNNAGYNSTTANSYVKIDLRNKEGMYKIKVNAEISSEANYDYGYATITESDTAPQYSNSTNRFIYLSGNVAANDYYSKELEGGKVYYLHLGYRKNDTQSVGDDQFKINSIDLYNLIEHRYKFNQVNGKYISNNQGVDGTVANSYIPIDLRQTKGRYTLKVNAEISSQSGYDYGYATMTTNTTAPEYNSYSGRFILISGSQDAKDYTTTLNGGNLYYLHLGYRKDASTSMGADIFTINSIELSLNTSDFFSGTYETDKYGQINARVTANRRYKITEIKAPEGYELSKDEVIFDVKDGQDNVVTIYNQHKRQIIVHHYLKDNTKEGDDKYTEIKVAEDEFQEGDIGQGYTTSPRFDLDSLNLEKNEDGKYVIPENASGTYGDSLIEVNYYYELKPIELKINHYLDGTETALVDEKKEEYDSTITFNDDGTYQITAEGSYEPNTNEDYLDLLADKYELVRIESSVSPEVNVDDTFRFNENSELRYYYKLKEHKITTEVREHIESRTNSVTNEKEDTLVKGGQISGEDDSPYEVVSHEENSNNEITATPDAGYRITKIILESGNGDDKTTTVIYDEENESDDPAEIKYVKNPDGSITLKALDDTTNDLFTNVTEDKHIIVEFAPEQAKIVIHHYLEGTGEEFGTDPVRVLTTDGVTEHEDEVRYDFVGEPYATKPSDNVNKRYKYVSSSTNTSGKYTDETTHVYYYYNLDDFAYSIHYFYDGVEKEENMVQGDKVLFGSEITEYPDKPEGYIFNKVEPTDTEDERKTKLTITENEEENVINVYYVSYCEITTEVIEHEEKYSDGTTELVKGGTISGEDEAPYEEVQKYHDSTKDIVITPDDGYEIARVIIKDLQSETETELNIDSFKAEDGSITLNNENGYFGNMTSNKHVEVEFSKKTKVVVKYLSVDETDDNGNPLVLAEEVVIEGKQDDEYNTQRKVVTDYITAKKELTDGTEASETYENSDGTYTKYDQEAEHRMYADTTTIIYWYKKAPRGNIIVRHIEIDESEVKDGLTLDSGKELDVEMYSMDEILDEARQSLNPDEPLEVEQVINRKTYTDSEYGRAYINVNGPTSSDDNMQIVSKDDSQHTVIVKEDGAAEEVIEVRFYYERQYKITTKVQPHTEVIDGTEESIKGGSITGDGMSAFELVNRMGSNAKSIIATPGEKYRIKYLTVNDKELNIADVKDEEEIAKLLAGFFKNVTEDKHIVVEYEKIPARVVVKYLEDGTEKELSKEVEINGLIDDEYKTYENEIDGYEIVKDKYPTNAKGNMTEEEILVIYYYKKIQDTPVQPDDKETEEKDQDKNEKIIPDSKQYQSEKNSAHSVKTGDNEAIYLVAMTIASVVMLAAIIAKRF